VALIYFVRKRRDLPFHWMFFMFGMFIFGCGTTHAMEVWTLWHGTYRLAGVIKALTAVVSMATAVTLVLLIPRALLLPSPGQLRAANLEMEREIAERLRAEEALRANEIQLNGAQHLARIGSWEQDIEAHRIHWSDEMHRIYGTSEVPSDFPALLTYVHPADRNELLEKEATVRSNTAPVDVEYRIIRPDGEVRFVHSILKAIRNAQGALVRVRDKNGKFLLVGRCRP
jgi:PAS domain-containing protein